MEIKGFIDMSFVDWDRKLSSVIFLPNCNFRCPFCHNGVLVLSPDTEETIPFEYVEDYLKKHKDWIDGICLTGGEPTLHMDLPQLCQKLKKMGFLVKIDTNGTNPMMMKKLMNRELIDYIAVDIKAPLTLEKYSKSIGVDAKRFLGKVKKTIEILLGSQIDYEFRTTVVPTLHRKEDIKEICSKLKGCRQYVLQKFDVSLGKTTLDPEFSKLKPFTDEQMKDFVALAQQFLPYVKFG